MMEERRKVKGKDVSKYKELGSAIRQKCREEKEAWWNKQCDEIEKEFYRNPSVAHIKSKGTSRKNILFINWMFEIQNRNYGNGKRRYSL